VSRVDTELIIRALKQVPEARLRLIDLAWQLVMEDGSLNVKLAAFLVKDLDEAIAEVRGYAAATQEAVRCLRRMALS